MSKPLQIETSKSSKDQTQLVHFCKQLHTEGYRFKSGDAVCDVGEKTSQALGSIKEKLKALVESLAELMESTDDYLVAKTGNEDRPLMDALEILAAETMPEGMEKLQKSARSIRKQLTVRKKISIDSNEARAAVSGISNLFKKSFTSDVHKICKAVDGDEDERFVLGVVLEPTDGSDGNPIKPDTDGDVYNAEEIRKAAYWFMENGKQHGILHGPEFGGEIFPEGDDRIVLLENFITPVDIPEGAFGEGSLPIKKGTWMMGLRINDDKLWQDVKDKEINGLSIGGVARETPFDEVENAQRLEDFQVEEVSTVPSGANRFPFILRKHGTNKGATPHKSFPLADEEQAWDGDNAEFRLREWASADGSGDKEQMDWAKYQAAFLWFDEDEPESFGSYKMPVIDVIDGNAKLVWNGVVAAFSAMQGARGGVTIPESDRDGVLSRLKKHYADFDKEWPIEKSDDVSLLEVVDEDEHLVTGVVLVPDRVDGQGDVASDAVIKCAAHNFLVRYSKQKRERIDVRHKKVKGEIELVESYLAPDDLVIKGRKIKKGSWIVTVKVLDEGTWQEVKQGDLRAFSVLGSARGKPRQKQVSKNEKK